MADLARGITRQAHLLTQLHTPMPLDTPKGRGYAHFIIDYGQEHSVIWGVLIDATREWWWPPNEDVLGLLNWTMRRREGVEADPGRISVTVPPPPAVANSTHYQCPQCGTVRPLHP